MSARIPISRRWERFFRDGPFVLLAAATAISAASGTLLTTPREWYVVAALVPISLALLVWWRRTGQRPPGKGPYAPDDLTSASSGMSQVYYWARSALAFALTWLNPFFAIFTTIGYFDAAHLLPRRWLRTGLLFTALTMAGSQSGGLPPVDGPQWIAFGALMALNSSLALLFSHLGTQEADDAVAQNAVIGELERANARLEQALRENAGLHAQLLVQAREAGIGDERRRLAAEIHDTIAQGLAGIITQLQAAADSGDPEVAGDHVERAAALARHSLGEARRSVQDLGPGALEHDALPEALAKVVTAWSASTGVRAEFTVTGTAEPLHAEVEATVLRIAQEALANSGRHAGATRLGVTLSYMEDEVSLDVRDDGRGFDPRALPPRESTRGFGLGGMRARAERIAGRLEVESEPGRGTAVSARVPLVRHG
ncbi:sensor histidine kinase [Sphaerisporangium corydalis]|uniref:Oxygen sensor histidine kinase NreB n=1 Tax=Sphaerisporangium corydalis TaxID=1441875 RepID=A0ABV9EQX3_9ACTN|nr:sensor histidine kinase [Sphaerisporangium corydalis]